MAVYIQCPACKGAHRAFRQWKTRQEFEDAPIETSSFTCPVRDIPITYGKRNLTWQDDAPKAG